MPSEQLTIVTTDGNRFVLKMSEIERITREQPEPVGGRDRGTGAYTSQTWYTVWGLGFSSVSYDDDDLDEMLEFLDGLPGVDRTTINIDMLGFYFPSRDGRSLVGFIVNGVGDRFDFDGDWFQVNGYTLSASAIHYTQATMGKGPFVRGDLGFSRLAIDSSGFGEESSDWGFGGLLGAGVSYPLTPGTFLAVTASYAFRRIAGNGVGNWGLAVTGTF